MLGGAGTYNVRRVNAACFGVQLSWLRVVYDCRDYRLIWLCGLGKIVWGKVMGHIVYCKCILD